MFKKFKKNTTKISFQENDNGDNEQEVQIPEKPINLKKAALTFADVIYRGEKMFKQEEYEP